MAGDFCFRIASLAVLLLVLGSAAAGRKGRCEVCKNFVKAFEKGLKSTENSNFAGGDTSWEEEKLGSYANSEVRFVEILDGVCKDYECHTLLEENEEHVERWWFKLRHKKPDLKLWFCHDQLDVCCPDNTFGPTCQECPGGVDDPCGGQGTCEGAEEKDGVGTCRCNRGYRGDSCRECDRGFYNDSSSCVACHRACRDDCSGGGVGDCLECASGYSRSGDDEGAECKDVNECEEREREMEEEEEGGNSTPLCEEGKYCFNTQGSYRCNDCDRSCQKGCSGPGPAKCEACGAGYYTSKFNICKDINECEGGEGWEGEPVTCEGATFCENTPGSYQCRACHVACLGGCRGAGPTNCVDCKQGFKMDDGECKDVNECEDESVCDVDSENCSNLIGSFKCKCKPGLVRVEGKCVEKVVKERESKKKTKKKKKAKKDGAGEGEEETKRMQFPWYHVLAPLSLAIVTYKFSRPNLASSVSMTVVLVAAALHS
ncbi:Cysteine-rich with EGF-like domain protein 2-B [Geodia barretti]|uniref:protein disulfide-isomerase n=1 Tax=Geodia barretti TaxID=519541 RepID=A0AA35TY10_GEOBA|nr:Cysteine-rich with EGF-like domain protein 2-B [Geodia barretti]